MYCTPYQKKFQYILVRQYCESTLIRVYQFSRFEQYLHVSVRGF